jgi:peptide/nickel transport system permease protein
LKPPSSTFLFGTDNLGRDVFSRIIYGGRVSVDAAFVVLAVVIVIGGTLGAISGYYEGIIDSIIMRVTDVFLSFPSMVLAMAVNAAIGPSLIGAFFAIGFVWWPGYARLIRAQVLSVKNSGFIDSARAIGCKDSHIILKHILPNCISPIIVKMTLDVGFVILTMATLSFIGLGAQPPTPEWGAMVTQGRAYIISEWWMSTFPGLAIMISVIGFNLFGDGLREILDPKLHFGEVA